jgi:hypothetical protein
MRIAVTCMKSAQKAARKNILVSPVFPQSERDRYGYEERIWFLCGGRHPGAGTGAGMGTEVLFDVADIVEYVHGLW